MALVSPGVEVNVIDESFYTPAGAGTVPMIFVATATNKATGSGSGTAAGTLAANAGKPYLITSQRELVETFGDPIFYSDSNGNMIHAGELNEYGLQAAYSLLGVTNRVYVARADVDLAKLEASADAPGGEPTSGTYWLDTDASAFGVQEWNGNPVTTTGGQTFTTQEPLVITSVSQVTGTASAPGAPKGAVGAIGDYAIVAITTLNTLYYKSNGSPAMAGSSLSAVAQGTWVAVGSVDWRRSHALVRGSVANPTITPGDNLLLDGNTVVASGATVASLANDIQTLAIDGISAAVVDSSLEIYTTRDNLSVGGALASVVGITADTYYAPKVTVGTHTEVPAYKLTDDEPRATGSIWLKTTEPNGGAKLTVKVYNGDTQLWETAAAPLYDSAHDAINELDSAGGGVNLAIGDLFVKVDDAETPESVDSTNAGTAATWKLYRRQATGTTRIVSAKISAATALSGNYNFDIQESTKGSASLSTAITVAVQGLAGAASDADDIANAINSAGFTNVQAEVTADNRVAIFHKIGGEIRLADTDGLLNDIGYTPYDPADPADPNATANLYDAPAGDTANDFVASNWKVLTYEASTEAPTTLAPQGELWYSSVVDEIDIMVHNGAADGWQGYQNVYPDTSPAGPIVSATEPEAADGQSDGSALVDGDLWIDTADIENFPTIYRWNSTLSSWVLIDKTDQTTENGVLFADARWATAGSDDEAADIEDLLVSDYLDPDAPDPALYPKGMLLWNMRRSGFNVKRFERNYVDVNDSNARFGDQDMSGYYPHRWVTDSGNNADGSGTFGRHAQRKSVVQGLQAVVNSNDAIRDEESRQFNLIACPGYPELIGEMITLNYDRRLTAFVVGDSPARLTPDATSLNEWASNVRLAVEDNDDGAVSFDEYMGMYYPWGFTSDNDGNNVVVPPSHMALRTLVLNDQVAYPWFAPAGTRRGGVTNATATGYVTSEGEFESVALNTGQRDTLYTNSINPITFISGSGLVVFGQKTRARNASALDRINVARLIVYMRVQLEKLARPYLFEPNDKITRDQVKAAAEALCLELVSLRALYDFVVVCDETNNTPARIDRNELWLDIAIEPVKAIEFIYIPLRIKNTGEIAALG